MKIELVSKTIGVNSYKELSDEEIIAAVARHGKIKDDNGKLVKYLMDNKHWSPLQFIQFTFKIETSRRISQQIFRHGFEKQEYSQRYEKANNFQDFDLRLKHKTNRQSSTKSVMFCTFNENNEPKFSYAKSFSKSQKYIKEITKLYNQINNLYEDMLEDGIARECAANILPMNTTTHIHISGNLRTYLSFLNVRCDEHSQLEIRLIAEEIGLELEKQLPNIFKVIDWKNGMFM